VKCVSTEEQKADALTKAMPAVKLAVMRRLLGVRDLSACQNSGGDCCCNPATHDATSSFGPRCKAGSWSLNQAVAECAVSAPMTRRHVAVYISSICIRV
jgi:hypothetical protein